MIRRLIAIVALAFPSLASAEETPKPNTLTPKEIEEGWILLFDGETTFGWKTEGNVKVEKGQLHVIGSEESSITSTSKFGPCELQFDYSSRGRFEVNVSSNIISGNSKETWDKMKIEVGEDSSMKYWSSEKERTPGAFRSNQAKETIAAPILLSVPQAVELILKNIKVRPTHTKPLLNGKDLSGWKVFNDPKRSQSKWSVTKEGWLNVKNGPGDLQTESQYADFMLQLECISNGKALNSGLFFRCIANEYQNGYEMQIQNGFKDNDRTKPADFGTGAIYRRAPARKVVSNDNEWFTMTLLVHGNHIATWVNGYQTVDWADNRPPDNNPRKGSKIGAGHLSIQGHDPTTDLTFRNIRILKLKTDKRVEMPHQLEFKAPMFLELSKEDPKDDELRKLLKARYNAALLAAHGSLNLYLNYRGDLVDLFEAEDRLIHAGLELCETPADKIALFTKLMKMNERAEGVAKGMLSSARGTLGAVGRAQYQQLDLEIQLLRTRRETDKAKGK